MQEYQPRRIAPAGLFVVRRAGACMIGNNEDAFVKRLFGNLVLAAVVVAVLSFFAAPAVAFFAIRSAAEANDVAGLAARHPELEMVAFNGAAAEALFRRHVLRGAGNAFAGVEFARLPSTSPANAGKTEAEKTAIWRNLSFKRSVL